MAQLVKNKSANYLTVGDGKIIRRLQNPSADSLQRTTNDGKVINEERYDKVSGRITDITFKDHPDYGRFINVHLGGDGDPAILQMKVDSGYAGAFLKILPNVDLQHDVELAATIRTDGDKKKTGMFISQNGNALKWFYTRENPGDLPQLVKKKFKGKEVWDGSDQMEFLENMVTKDILPKLKKKDVDDDDDSAPF